jgi:hypothetical protein
MANITELVFYLALLFMFFGLYSTFKGLVVVIGGRIDRRPMAPSSINAGYEIVLTAGIGQLVVSGILILFHYGVLQIWSGGPATLIAFYILFSTTRAFSLFNFSNKLEAGLRFDVCLLINFLWPLVSVLVIPIHLIDMRDRLQQELALVRTKVILLKGEIV